MAADLFLKLDGIRGESRDAKHPDEIQLLAYSWGMSQPHSMHTGTGGGAGKAKVNDLTKLTVRVDVSPYFKKTKNGEIILKYCNAFIPADFWKYSPDSNESNALGKSVEQQNAPLEFENK